MLNARLRDVPESYGSRLFDHLDELEVFQLEMGADVPNNRSQEPFIQRPTTKHNVSRTQSTMSDSRSSLPRVDRNRDAKDQDRQTARISQHIDKNLGIVTELEPESRSLLIELLGMLKELYGKEIPDRSYSSLLTIVHLASPLCVSHESIQHVQPISMTIGAPHVDPSAQ